MYILTDYISELEAKFEIKKVIFKQTFYKSKLINKMYILFKYSIKSSSVFLVGLAMLPAGDRKKHPSAENVLMLLNGFVCCN